MWTRREVIENLERVDRLMQENGIHHIAGEYANVIWHNGQKHLCLCSLGALYFYSDDKPKTDDDIRGNTADWACKTIGANLMSTIMALNDGVSAVYLAPSIAIDNPGGMKTPAEIAAKLKEAWGIVGE